MADAYKEQERTELHRTIWSIANDLRGSVDGWDFKQYILGILFYRYISENLTSYINAGEREAGNPTFDYSRLTDSQAEFARAGLVDEKGFFILPSELFENVRAKAGKVADLNMTLEKIFKNIEKSAQGTPSEPNIKGLFDDMDLNSNKLGSTVAQRNVKLVKLLNGIGDMKLGDYKDNTIDAFGDAYEYLMQMYASNAGKSGGEYYTPQEVSELLTRLTIVGKTEVNKVYDPACGSGGMFSQSARFVREHQGNIRDVSIFGQESNPTTWKLAKMNLALRGLEANLGKHNADSFHDDQHKTLKANYILANPPFNISDWGGERLQDDVRWAYGIPPVGNANYAWLQHMLHHLNPVGGVAGTVLANGSLSTNTSNEGEIRKNMIKGDVVECIVSLPGQLFYSTGIPVSLWIMRKGKTDAAKRKILFLDARNLGFMVDRKVRELSEEDIQKIASTYQNWRHGNNYQDIQGFCKSATLEEVAQQDYILTPGRYVGIAEQEDDGEPFEEKMIRLTTELYGLFEESHKLEDEICKKLAAIGYGK